MAERSSTPISKLAVLWEQHSPSLKQRHLIDFEFPLLVLNQRYPVNDSQVRISVHLEISRTIIKTNRVVLDLNPAEISNAAVLEAFDHVIETLEEGFAEINENLETLILLNEKIVGLLRSAISILENPHRTECAEFMREGMKWLRQGFKSRGAYRTKYICDAKRFFKLVIEDPIGRQNYLAWFALGWIAMYEDNDVETSVIAFDESCRLSIDSRAFRIFSLRHLAHALSLVKRFDEALDIYDRVPEDTQTLYLACVLEKARFLALAEGPVVAKAFICSAIDHSPVVADVMWLQPDLIRCGVNLYDIVHERVCLVSNTLDELERCLGSTHSLIEAFSVLHLVPDSRIVCSRFSSKSHQGGYSLPPLERVNYGEMELFRPQVVAKPEFTQNSFSTFIKQAMEYRNYVLDVHAYSKKLFMYFDRQHDCWYVTDAEDLKYRRRRIAESYAGWRWFLDDFCCIFRLFDYALRKDARIRDLADLEERERKRQEGAMGAMRIQIADEDARQQLLNTLESIAIPRIPHLRS